MKLSMNLYVDLDGVLVNFWPTFSTQIGEWNDQTVPKFLDDNGFENLPAFPNATYLLKNFIAQYREFQVIFLSSKGGIDDPRIYAQKRAWLDKNGLFNPLVCVDHKGFKKVYASPLSILVDDTQANIDDFDKCHGHGIKVDPAVGLDKSTIMQIHLIAGYIYSEFRNFPCNAG